MELRQISGGGRGYVRGVPHEITMIIAVIAFFAGSLLTSILIHNLDDPLKLGGPGDTQGVTYYGE